MRGRHPVAAASGALLAIVGLAGGAEAAGIGGNSGIGGGSGIGAGAPTLGGSSLTAPGSIGHHSFGGTTLVLPPAPVLDLRSLGTATGGPVQPIRPLHAVGVTVTQNGPTTPAPFATFDLSGHDTIRPGSATGTRSIASSSPSTASPSNQVTLAPTVLAGGNLLGTRLNAGFDLASVAGGGATGSTGGTLTIVPSGGTATGTGSPVTIAG